MLKAGERPDFFLVVARSDLMGQLAVGTKAWRSADSWLLSFSECPGQQEAMLLMALHGWIRTDVGRFVLESSQSRAWVAQFALSFAK
jgi:hypothetical protein